MKTAILSTDRLPEFLGVNHPNEEELFAEDLVLINAFAKHGISAERISWHQKNSDLSDYNCILVRSTWDYIDHLDSYFQVLEAIRNAGCHILNPVETIRWNSNKRYLIELEKMGIPIVPTYIVEIDPFEEQSVHTFGRKYSSGYVVKPLVGVGAYATHRYSGTSKIFNDIQLGVLQPPLLVQPFVPAIQTEGEWSFVFASGEFLYSVLKIPDRGDFRTQIMHGAKTCHLQPSAKDLSTAQNVLSKLHKFAHLARVDMVRMSSGELALMELELIEPQLYLNVVEDAADMIAEATLKHLSEK